MYNYLNLPYKITFPLGRNGEERWIKFTYDASGVKLKKERSDDYVKDYIFDTEYMDGTLDAVYHQEGRAVPLSGGNFEYQYVITDHLGNTRLMFKDGGNGVAEIIQENNYYSFGLTMRGIWDGDNLSDYTYTGKELNEDFRLNMLDYGARQRDEASVVWWQIDPLETEIPSWSPYSYSFNNPISFNDPTGMMGNQVIYDFDGNAHEITSDDTKNIYSAPETEEVDEDCCPGVDIKTRMSMAHMLASQDGLTAEEWFNQLTEVEGNAALRAGEIALSFAVGEFILAKVLQGGRWIWISYQASKATRTMSSVRGTVDDFVKLLRPQNNVESTVTLYRGTTGSEKTGNLLFLTDDAKVAKSYVKNGGKVVRYDLSASGLYKLRHSGQLQTLAGKHGGTGVTNTEYKFIGNELKKALNIIGQ